MGDSEDSYTPAVFDITEKVREGENKIALEVYRFSSGSWLEDLFSRRDGAEKAKVSWKLYDGRIRMEPLAEEEGILSREEWVSVTESTAAVQFTLNVPEVHSESRWSGLPSFPML